MVLTRLPASHVWSVRLSIAVAEPTVSTKPSTLKYVHKAIPDITFFSSHVSDGAELVRAHAPLARKQVTAANDRSRTCPQLWYDCYSII